MKAASLSLACALPIALAACAQQAEPGERPPVTPAARVVGEASNCIPLAQINETRVRDDYTINFLRSANRGWRVTLPNRCSGLGFDRAFAYETSLSQLCSTDIIYPLRTIGGRPERFGSCGLGQFVPVEIER